MKEADLNDFIVDILQDFYEIESSLKVLKNSVFNENCEITMQDIGNNLELIITKFSNTKNSLNKYIDSAFK